MHDQKTLKTKEMVALLLIFVGMKLADTTPSMLAPKAQNAFWLIPLVSFTVIFPSFLILLYLLKKYKNKNLIELMEAILGKYVGKLIGFILFLLAYVNLALDSRNYVEQIKLLYFPESPTAVIFILFMGVIFLGAIRGFEVIGFTSWIGLPLIKFSIYLVAILILKEAIFQRIFPIFGSGLEIILSQGIQKASLFMEMFLLTIAYTSFKDTKYFRKGGRLASLIIIVEILLFYLLYCTVFDYNSVEKVAFPFHDITQFVNFGDYFTNVETFFMVFWLFAAYMRFIIYLYIITWIFGAIFNIHEFEPLIIPMAYLTFMIGILPKNSVINELVIREQLLSIMSPLFIAFPIILWVISLSKGDLKRL